MVFQKFESLFYFYFSLLCDDKKNKKICDMESHEVDSTSSIEEEEFEIPLPSLKRPMSQENPSSPKRQKTDLERRQEGFLPQAEQSSTPVNSTKRRRLVRYIKRILHENPKADLFAVSQLDRDLGHMDEQDLVIVLDNLKSQCGIQANSVSHALIQLFGTVAEKALKKEGLQCILCKDTDLICAVEDLLPENFLDFGNVVQIGASIFTAIQQLNSKPPETKPKANGNSSAPLPTHGDGEVPNGQNNIRSETNSDSVR